MMCQLVTTTNHMKETGHVEAKSPGYTQLRPSRRYSPMDLAADGWRLCGSPISLDGEWHWYFQK